MSTITMTIAAINPPKPDKKRGTIQGTDGTRLGVFAEKIGLFTIGHTYEIDHTDGEYRNVLAARPVSAPVVSLDAARAAAAPAAATPQTKEYGWQTHPVDAERMFVCSILNAAITAGKVSMDKAELAATTVMLRGLWNYAFVANGAARQPPRTAQG